MTAIKTFPLDDDHTTRAWLATVWFMFAMLIMTVPAMLLDERTLWEISVWWKPLKFELALMIHFATLAILAQQLPVQKRAGLVMTGAVWASVAAALMEIVYITIQAARGRHSHFNFDTPFESAMYAVMGAGALLLVLAPLIMGVFIALLRDGDKSGFRLGAVLGLIIGPILTIIFAGYMSSINASHWVGEATSDAGGVPLFGWSRDVGDLRPPHFFATHAIQILPLAGLAADRLTPGRARSLVVAAAVINTGIAVYLFWLALQGKPVIGV